MRISSSVVGAVILTTIGLSAGAAETMSLEKAAQKSNNPVGDAWLLITQNDLTLRKSPEGDKWQNTTSFQPVMPVHILDGKWNLVNRIVTGVTTAPVGEDFNSPNFFDQRTTGNTNTIAFSLAAPNRDDAEYCYRLAEEWQGSVLRSNRLGHDRNVPLGSDASPLGN